MLVLEGVKRWRALAKQLLFAYDKEDTNHLGGVDLDALQRQHGSDEDCLKAIVKCSLEGRVRQYQQPTWRAIIYSLYSANEMQLAYQFRSYAEPVKGESIYFCMHSGDCMLQHHIFSVCVHNQS